MNRNTRPDTMTQPSPYRYLPANMAESLRRLSISVRRPVQGPAEGRHRSPHYGASVEFAEYREYSPGDPTNLIDWSVYARSDRYVVRRFIEETNLRAYLLLDTSESLAFRDEAALTKMEYACFLAAGLMFILLNQGDSVGLLTFGARILNAIPPAGTLEGMRPLLRALETVRAEGAGDIEAALHEAAARVHARSLVILVSDLLQDSRAIIRGIRHLHHDGHNVLVMHVMDPGERRLSFGGVAELRELETGHRMVVEADEIRDAYHAAVQRHIRALRFGCAECMCSYHQVDTRAPIEESLTGLQVQLTQM